jgi:TonB family protein
MRVRKNPPYVQGRWHPSAWEWAPQEQLLANACYEASPQLLVVAWISYGRAEVGEQDARLIRELLDRVADSVDRGPHKNGQVTETAAEFLSGLSPSGGVIGGIISSTPVAVPNVANPQRVRVSLGASQGMLIKKVNPAYPPLARQARIQGTVLLQAEISKDGTVENLTLISGHPMLIPAAIEAVKQWVYRPYVINNAPVAVETQIQVNFALSPDPTPTPGVNIGASSETTPENK